MKCKAILVHGQNKQCSKKAVINGYCTAHYIKDKYGITERNHLKKLIERERK